MMQEQRHGPPTREHPVPMEDMKIAIFIPIKNTAITSMNLRTFWNKNVN